MTTKTKAAENGTQQQTPVQELDAWLKERGYQIVPKVVGPTGEKLSILSAMKADLRNDGWQPIVELVKRGDNSSSTLD